MRIEDALRGTQSSRRSKKKTGLDKKQTLQEPSEPTERRIQYSRIMIAKVTLPSSVGFIGKEHNVMVVHMHNELANLVHGPKKLEEFWEWLLAKITKYDVEVLMVDFNMSLFRVIPELRSRGVQMDFGAW